MARTPKVVTLTWTIPEHIGGMTATMLDRSILLTEAGYDCELISFAPTQAREADAARLTADGRLPAAGALLNLWDILAAAALPAPSRGIQAHDEVLDDSFEAWIEAGVVRTRTRFAADGQTILQMDHFRPDGSLLAVDRRDAPVAGSVKRRRVTLFDAAGQPVRVWKSIWALYSFALDAHLGGARTVLIYDSKVTSKFASYYRRAGVATVHVIHNRHLAGVADRPYGELAASRADVMHNLEAFDRVVCSTGAQRDDIETMLGTKGLVHVIPPAIAEVVAAEAVAGADAGTPLGEHPHARRQHHGVVLSSLEPRKRLDHIIRAVALVREHVPDITLDIFGTGDRRTALEALIAELDLEGAVHLRGHASDAKRQFASASWTALTSTHEGFGMAIAEALTAGCQPFAYDVAYGPAEILRAFPEHLIADERPETLAARLREFLELSDAEREAQRVAGREEAARFRPAAVAERWTKLIRGLKPTLGLSEPRPAEGPLPLSFRARSTPAGIEIEAEFGLARERPLPTVLLLGVASAKPELEWREPATVRRIAGTRYRATAVLPRAQFPAAVSRAESGSVDFVAVRGARPIRTVIAHGVTVTDRWSTVIGVRGARRWVAALRRRLGRVKARATKK